MARAIQAFRSAAAPADLAWGSPLIHRSLVARVVRAIAQELGSMTLRLGQLQMASMAAEKDDAPAKRSFGRKRSHAERDIVELPTPQELGGTKARRKDVRSCSTERRNAMHAVLENSYEADYQEYRESMPPSASAGMSEEDIRASFMEDNARRIAKGITSTDAPGPSLELPDESESEQESETEAPSTTDLDNAIRDWGMDSFREAEKTVDGYPP